MKLTILSDTHNKHKQILASHIVGGDVIVHSGDISSMGYEHEVRSFLKWFSNLNYEHKIFIAGNHDWMFERDPALAAEILEEYENITYLQDSYVVIDGIKFYGSPWQPEFYNWAFNIPRDSEQMAEKWNEIPDDTDVLITHGPPYGKNDRVIGRHDHLGCERLAIRVKEVKPLIHCYGHIHSGNGILLYEETMYVNNSVIDERYDYSYLPGNFIIDENREVRLA